MKITVHTLAVDDAINYLQTFSQFDKHYPPLEVE